MTDYRVAVLMTSFNRREFTLRSLRALRGQRGLEGLGVSVFLVDDGSTDGTGSAVAVEFPDVRILRGNGTLYWNRGMRMAFDAALREGFDAYVLLNDDTMLYEDAVRRLADACAALKRAGKTAIVAGSTRSAEAGVLSYGGIRVRRQGLQVSFEKVAPHEEMSIECDTMNGNIVWIPAEVAQKIGNLDARFHHHFGDLDYGMRAVGAGFTVAVAPGYLGTCGNNTIRGTWRDTALPLAKRWKSLLSPKGQPPREWLLFTVRYYGWRWPLYACSPYVKTVMTSLRREGRAATLHATKAAGN